MSNHQGFEVVLVVDDNGAVLSMTELMLTRHGYRAIVCQSGTQAIDLVRDWPELEIDVTLVDVVLGDISGTDVAKEILRYKPDLPIIFMTEFPEHHEVLALQGQTVFKKPFTSLLMIQTIRGASRPGRGPTRTTLASAID